MAYETENTKKLAELLPVLVEKEKQGLINGGSVSKAQSLLKWVEYKPLTEKQELLVGRLLSRATRKHKSGGPIQVTNTQVVHNDVNVEEVTKQVLAKIGTADAHKVTIQAVIEALDKRVPRRVEYVVTNQGKSTTAKDEPRHEKFGHLLKAASVRLPNGYAPGIFLQGEASSGKTTGARQLAQMLKLDWHFNGAISFPHEMLGFIDGAGKYHRTPFRDAYEHGGVYTFDEVDRSDPVALLAVNPHLANGIATFPDKQIKRHKDCIIVGTANTWGLGGDNHYSGATKLDAAFLSRFPIRISWDIDAVLEKAIVGNDEWLAKVQAARERARTFGLKVLIDTRAAQAGAGLIAAGYTMQQAADMTYLANLKPEQRKQVEG